jgi:hypothetical protein
MPEIVKSLAAKWQVYATANEVVHPDTAVAYGKPPKPGKY